MPTQLNYAFITQPNPGYLVAGQIAELEFTVSNPADPVTLSSLGFTFPYGCAGSDLCASVGDVSATALPGPEWTAGPDEFGNFVLTPPKGSISIGLDGLAFTLSIQVNSQFGVVNLNSASEPVQSFTIEESTSAGSGYWSPADPLSKFPAEFKFSNLVANPPIVQQGGPIELSWMGTAGASYTIDWPNDEFITYSGGLPPITLSDTSFPPTGQTLKAGASRSAFFSVTAEYKSGGQTLSAGPLTVNVDVELDTPTIKSFTATWQGAVLALAWQTEGAVAVHIPSITPYTLNPNSETPLLFTPSSAQPLPSSITLTAINQASQTASQTLVQGSYQQVVGSPVPVGLEMSVAVSPDGTRVFVANQGNNTLTVLDAQTLKPISGSPVSVDTPRFVAVSPNGTRVFVANAAHNTLTVLDAGTLKPISGSPVPVGFQPYSIAVSSDGTRLFVANEGNNTLTVLDAQTLQPITGSPVPVGKMPYSVALSPDGARVFVANNADNTLTVLDAGTLQPISGSPVQIGKSPMSVAVSPDGTRVFVANFEDNTLTVLDGGTLQPISRSPFPVGKSPMSVAVSPDGARVFVANFTDNTLMVLTPAFVPANG